MAPLLDPEVCENVSKQAVEYVPDEEVSESESVYVYYECEQAVVTVDPAADAYPADAYPALPYKDKC
jgi:hypothetical protein